MYVSSTEKLVLKLSDYTIPSSAKLFKGNSLIKSFKIKSAKEYTVDFIKNQDKIDPFEKVKLLRQVNLAIELFNPDNIEIQEKKDEDK